MIEQVSKKTVTHSSRRARLEGMLLHGTKLGAIFLALGAFVSPKLPPLQGE